MIRRDTDKHLLYVKMYESAKESNDKDHFLKGVFNGVRAVDTLLYENTYTKEQLETGCKLSDEVQELLKQATPRQIMQLFPIHKEYDGEKWSQKDYFSTMKYLKGLELDKSIGDNLEEFLWHYYHWDIMQFYIIYDTYHREREYQEYQNKAERFHKEIKAKAKEINHIGELVMNGLEIIKDSDRRIAAIKEKIQSKSSIVNFIERIKLKKMEHRRYVDWVYCKFLSDYKEDLLVEYASIEGWDEYIEELAKADRGKANEAIGVRNRLLNKCY
ncbi:hypothetical protein [Cellulosilyticum lentocellum]|uniref:Uncharacterized protein n=1 Tax=Cellulosilyticum lentocellum (strain ATCC 49066 / DSM 5427 / NCIMB 11756 / RHM5) TaxID=642492 RepID=F2JQ53_CELLD|nr:hypothetical protein [Cellulosilyticum lentocellum]ADZ82601.1 hypothetical protein Clole_0868 [Cellulosilyticum lentocellum DSM 5427]